jgi:dTDP-4-dehydrorhamnose 3,5-epimerase
LVNISDYKIAGLKLLEPRVFHDNRGYFFEQYNAKLCSDQGIDNNFVQDNISFSADVGTLRGLHMQAPPFAQGKLVSVVRGAIFDVAVDVRRKSPTYGKWAAVELSGSNHLQFWIPAGFLHGFQTLQPETIVTYKCSGFYDQTAEMGVRFDDHELSIDWPHPTSAILSEKDAGLPVFGDLKSPFQWSLND